MLLSLPDQPVRRLRVARTDREWAQDCQLYGTDVCTAFWEYLYLRHQVLRLIAQGARRGRSISLQMAWTFIWMTTVHTLGSRPPKGDV